MKEDLSTQLEQYSSILRYLALHPGPDCQDSSAGQYFLLEMLAKQIDVTSRCVMVLENAQRSGHPLPVLQGHPEAQEQAEGQGALPVSN